MNQNNNKGIKTFIKKAIEGGWDSQGLKTVDKVLTNYYHIPIFLFDPKAWKAVGLIEKWGYDDDYYHYLEIRYRDVWKNNMHQMLDHIIKGKDINSYLEELF